MRRFLAALAPGMPIRDHGDAVDALLVGAPGPNADLAAAAVALGRAVDSTGVEALPVAGPALVLVTVPSAAWVGPVAVVLRRHVEAARRGRIPDWEGDGAPVFLEGDGSAGPDRPDGRAAPFADALRLGSLVVGVSHDPARLLPRDLVRGAECRVALAPLDPDGVRLVVEAVTGGAPRRGVPAELAAACDPDDLVLAVHAVRGADASAGRLSRLLADKVSASDGLRLEDMVGAGAAREWGMALVADLRSWMSRLAGSPRWADLESAMLLSGPPGVGKTAFAAALARSAGLPFLASSPARWRSAGDGSVGHALAAMRAFFERPGPCVVLVDELDTLGWGPIAEALLAHLDEAISREGIVVVAAADQPDRLDPALLRPGRLERHVRIELPDAAAIAEMLRRWSGEALPDADLADLASRLLGMSGAEVGGLVRRARAAARRDGRRLAAHDLEAVVRILRPPLPEPVRARVAVHEAGHLLAAAAVGVPGPLSASITSDGGSAFVGFEADRGFANEERLDECLVVLMAGRAAEEIVLGDVTTGAVVDLADATRLAVSMETCLGFSSWATPIAFGTGEPTDALGIPWVAAAVHTRLRAAYDRALDLLRTHRHALDRVSAGLAREGRLDDAAIHRLLGRPLGAAGRRWGRRP